MFEPFILSVLMFMHTPAAPLPLEDPDLLTVAESSAYTATSSHAQVLEFIERLRNRSGLMRVQELGRTVESRSIPLLVFGQPEPDLNTRNRPLVFVMANIHAGEVEGKEASLMLARELATHPGGHHPLLERLDIVLCPNYNADGNDKFDTCEKNRPGQDGPAHVGVRPNAQGLDLNRDYIKLEAPESRALAKFLTDWDPSLTIDCHTTNGSHHRYVLTYDAPLNPSGHPAPIDCVRNRLLPEVTRRVKDRTGYDMWFYGNFNREHTAWETYSAQPRFGGPYQGLRGQMSVLSEAYSYAPYKDRVIATREFIREILLWVAEHADEVLQINRRARQEVVDRGRAAAQDDLVGIRHRIAAFDDPVLVKGFEGTAGKGGEGGAAIMNHKDLGAPKDYSCVHWGRFEPTHSVRRPKGYIIPPGFDQVLQKLRQHGINLEPFEGTAAVEVYTISSIERAPREFQGHQTVEVKAAASATERTLQTGSHLVRTAQPLGTLAVYLLEPESEDGLTTWNFFDEFLHVGKEFPLLRLVKTDK